MKTVPFVARYPESTISASKVNFVALEMRRIDPFTRILADQRASGYIAVNFILPLSSGSAAVYIAEELTCPDSNVRNVGGYEYCCS